MQNVPTLPSLTGLQQFLRGIHARLERLDLELVALLLHRRTQYVAAVHADIHESVHEGPLHRPHLARHGLWKMKEVLAHST